MVAPGGPDEETWTKMSKGARRSYWMLVIAFWLIFFGVAVKKLISN